MQSDAANCAASRREQPFDGQNLLHHQMPHFYYPGEPARQLLDYAVTLSYIDSRHVTGYNPVYDQILR
ncbi:hypothetical protein Nwat_0068 [Nitrosococcus watsonii C-113]|uniref:Uncharacterized protein n=1 Tax=Nitrosococcus watsoni (strain C-113) TaxID=105559 RepID=D8K860_NITWC|nr:hypothetical protein Nwat_0068 [Nitrosococcus watsonii C-113]